MNPVNLSICKSPSKCGGRGKQHRFLQNAFAFVDRRNRSNPQPTPPCSLITVRGSLSSRKPANFAWRKWSIYSYCTSSQHRQSNRAVDDEHLFLTQKIEVGMAAGTRVDDGG